MKQIDNITGWGSIPMKLTQREKLRKRAIFSVL